MLRYLLPLDRVDRQQALHLPPPVLSAQRTTRGQRPGHLPRMLLHLVRLVDEHRLNQAQIESDSTIIHQQRQQPRSVEENRAQ